MKLSGFVLRSFPLVLAGFFAIWPAFAQTAPKITTPKEELGFDLGEDYHLANYTQLEAYWKKLASESDRMKLVEIGRTAEDRPQYMAIVSSPENLKKLDHYKEISRKLAHAEGLSDDQAHALAKEGRSVVWIDGGLHASEVECAQALMEMVYQMTSRTDGETMRFLDDTILLFVQANPDGQELCANWYMRVQDPAKRTWSQSGGGIPRLYHKYIGHDDNRDFFMINMPETTNMSREMFIDWNPQIVYNHHQTGPPGAVIFMPPFRDPFNYNFDPLVMMELDQVGSAMHSRMEAEDKPGAGMRSAATYSTWYNGGLRTVTYFHNMVGLLTEIIGNPTPIEIPLIPSKQLPTGDLPFPIAPQVWHLRQSIEYSITANRAVIDYASRFKETLLYNAYRMGQNSIDRGNKDSWTVTPKRIAALRTAILADKELNKSANYLKGDSAMMAAMDPRVNEAGNPKLYNSVLHDPALRDPRGYIVPSDQADFPTAVKFINALIKSGVTIERATAAFSVAGKSYPPGSYIVKTSQAYRPHVLDMFEPQDHPNDFAYPGGPPIPPYDATGYTLAFQMGVQFDRILDAFNSPSERVDGLQSPPPGSIRGSAKATGFILDHRVNNSYVLVNRLLKAKCDVYWLKNAPEGVDPKAVGTGAIWIAGTAAARPIIQQGVKELGITAYSVSRKPTAGALKLKPIRIGLYDQYGGLMPSGWTRWLFEQFEFPFEVVHPQTLDAGGLNSRFDTIVFTDGAIRQTAFSGGMFRSAFYAAQPKPEDIPAEYRAWLGAISKDKTLPQLKQFVEAGGSVVTIGSSNSLAEFLKLPVSDALVEQTTEGKERPLPREKYYIPGALLGVSVDNTNPLAYGVPDKVDVFFDNSPVFRLNPDAEKKGTKPVAWFSSNSPLHSGWAWGQQYLNGGVAIADASYGSGKVFLLGPEVAFRGEPHATFKFLFNAVYYGSAKAVKP